jgi:predicted metalloprotease
MSYTNIITTGGRGGGTVVVVIIIVVVIMVMLKRTGMSIIITTRTKGNTITKKLLNGAYSLPHSYMTSGRGGSAR